MAHLAIDFDGTLVEDSFPHVGEAKPFALMVVRELRQRGHTLTLWTCREGKFLKEAVEWCSLKGISFDYINESDPKWADFMGGQSRKVVADMYIDDKTQFSEQGVNWHEIRIALEAKGWL